ncbi:hypothetical protein SAMN05421665_1606 [Yoonia rosea]|uniref:Uncharacterized protein n=1 Tax=Yoonia rosea TaxID=287098 RepID=A0A1R3WYC3_9RHOB|nr:hypothetical protein SAMN05421665_1606 [Yoonia rosea]
MTGKGPAPKRLLRGHERGVCHRLQHFFAPHAIGKGGFVEVHNLPRELIHLTGQPLQVLLRKFRVLRQASGTTQPTDQTEDPDHASTQLREIIVICCLNAFCFGAN